jgi:hypothetical protein
MATGDIYASTTDGTMVTFPCGPCATPTGCCLYPYPDQNGLFGGPFYPSSDLPIHLTSPGIGTWTLAGSYEYTLDSDPAFSLFANPSSAWQFSFPGSADVYTFSCLIGVYGGDSGGPDETVADEFSSTYSDGTNNLTRDTDFLCGWHLDNGIDPPGSEVMIYTALGTVLDDGTTSVTLSKPTWVITSFLSGTLQIFVKADPQSDPTGVYTNITTGATITIS